MCPGNFAYMPPEAMIEKPRYTEKIDCFSFGVVMIQVLTRERPEPGPQTEHVNIHINVAVIRNIPEIERRQNCIKKIDPGHALLPIALDCLKDRDVERPSAHQLCERIGALKESPQYTESKRSSSASEGDVHEQLQRERHQQEQSQGEIRRLRDEVR